jgi:glycosyltransferase involved in cell wall biosynthesis
MKASLVITVFNEEKTIERLLNSLAKQTEKPEEMVIVDGGSTDGTVGKTQESSSKFQRKGIKLKILIERGATIAQGRNRGIKEAKSEIIVMTDAGCEVHSDWFEKITKPFEKKDVDIVAGFYRMTGDSIFQKCLACYLGVLPERLDPENFMPSARSIAFKKEIWDKVGGFDEKLKRCGEDTLFNYQAKQLGAKFLTVKEALVDWEMPKTLKKAWQKFYNYAKGDGQISIWWDQNKKLKTHNLKVLIIYARYLFGLILFFLGFLNSFFWLVLIFLFLLYLFWAALKSYNYVNGWQKIFFLPMIQIISDLAVMAGFAMGSLKRK